MDLVQNGGSGHDGPRYNPWGKDSIHRAEKSCISRTSKLPRRQRGVNNEKPERGRGQEDRKRRIWKGFKKEHGRISSEMRQEGQRKETAARVTESCIGIKKGRPTSGHPTGQPIDLGEIKTSSPGEPQIHRGRIVGAGKWIPIIPQPSRRKEDSARKFPIPEKVKKPQRHKKKFEYVGIYAGSGRSFLEGMH